jgi:hypothetical protein
MIPEFRPVRHALGLLGPGERRIVFLSGRTRSSGARGPADDGASRLSRPCQAEAYGIESVGETVTPTRLVKASSVTGHAKPLRPARLFFWHWAQKNPSLSGMLGDGGPTDAVLSARALKGLFYDYTTLGPHATTRLLPPGSQRDHLYLSPLRP